MSPFTFTGREALNPSVSCFFYLCLTCKLVFWLVSQLMLFPLCFLPHCWTWTCSLVSCCTFLCSLFIFLQAFALLSFLVWSLPVPVPPLSAVSSPRLFTCSFTSHRYWTFPLVVVALLPCPPHAVFSVFCVLLQTSGCAFVLHRVLSLCRPTIIRLQSPALPTSCFHAVVASKPVKREFCPILKWV